VIATNPAEAKFLAGTEAGGSGDWKEAATLFAAAHQLDPSMHVALINQGVALERTGDRRAAAAAYRQVLALDSHNPEAIATLARTLIALGEIEEPRSLLSDGCATHPEDAVLLNLYAGVLRQTKEFDSAKAVARRVILRDQKSVSAMKTLALIYADEGSLDLAETFFANALKLAPDDAALHVNLGLLRFRRGEHQAAILAFEEARRLDPKNPAAIANVGAIALRFRDYKRAADAYQQAIDDGLVTCATMSGLGYAREGMLAGGEAVTQLGKAYALCPDQHGLLYSMGLIAMEQLRDAKAALDYFERFKQANIPGLPKDHPVNQYIDSIKAQGATPAPDASADEQSAGTHGLAAPISG
jgi:tetratricopeptide (TPR) repeat protein